jgi:hypothetical protein
VVKRAKFISAAISGVAFVLLVERLNQLHIATAETFAFLLPGIIVGCISPDAACTFEGDLHPPGILALILTLIVNFSFYGGVAYLAFGALSNFKTQRIRQK